MKSQRATGNGDISERFWNRVEKSGPDECWLWLGTLNGKDGYGVIGGKLNGKRYAAPGVKMLAHRASWIMHFGEIPENDSYHGTVVLHKCDNPRCVNPNHLELGTQQDNVADMYGKGRDNNSGLRPPRTGFNHHRAVMTPEKLSDVRRMIAEGVKDGKIATAVGVSRTTIVHIRQGKLYTAKQIETESP